MDRISKKTIDDFSAQWTRYTENDGFYGSTDLLIDTCGPLFSIQDIKGKRVLDVGSGTGRFVNIFLDLGAEEVIAIEPSEAIHVLRENVASRIEKVRLIQITGDQIPKIKADFAFCYGVLHHILDPELVVQRIFKVLIPGGHFLFWIYGREGNRVYLFFVEPLRKISQVMPDNILVGLSYFLAVIMSVYGFACRFISLPLCAYLRNVYLKLSWRERALNIFDQLNPAYAKYYSRQEAYDLMKSANFDNIRLYQRHGYSWTVIGQKPDTK